MFGLTMLQVRALNDAIDSIDKALAGPIVANATLVVRLDADTTRTLTRRGNAWLVDY